MEDDKAKNIFMTLNETIIDINKKAKEQRDKSKWSIRYAMREMGD